MVHPYSFIMKKALAIIVSVILITAACRNEVSRRTYNKAARDFDPATLDSGLKSAEGMNGQLLYLPVYSNIPYLIDTSMFDMSAFVAIHNTDLSNPITLTKVLYFNQDGKLVDDFLKDDNMDIMPLATKNYYIPYEDKSGTGANFLIEWISDTLVNEPLIESVTLCLKPNNTIAIPGKARIIRQNR